jgi:serine/threonine-protein kinase
VLGAGALAASAGIALYVQSDPGEPGLASPRAATASTDVLLPVRTSAAGARHAAPDTRSTEALRHYLFGRYHMEVRSRERMLDAEREFRNAIRLDPAYARAYAALSVVLTHSAFLGGRAGVAVMRQAREAATTAISLDDSVALAHTALGYVLECFEYDQLHSQAEHLRAVALDDSDLWVLRAYASFLMRRGAFDEGLAVIRRALALDPVSPLSQRHYAMLLYAARRYDECVSVSRTTLSLDQHDATLAYQWLARCLEAQGRLDEAVDAYEDGRAARGDPREAEHLKHVYRSRGWDAYWRERLRLTDSAKAADRAAALVRAGRRQEALDLFAKGFEARAPWIGFINHPQWDPLLPEPRFQAMRRRLGLDDRMVAQLRLARDQAALDTHP